LLGSRPAAEPAFRGAIGGGNSHFDPNQPPVPKGRPDGGQWTSDGSGIESASDNKTRTPLSWLLRPWARFAAADKPPPGRFGRLALLFRLLQYILQFKKDNKPLDLFDDREDE